MLIFLVTTIVAFSAHILRKLNCLNKSIREKQDNVLTFIDKISFLQQKLLLSITKIEIQATWDVFDLVRTVTSLRYFKFNFKKSTPAL